MVDVVKDKAGDILSDAAEETADAAKDLITKELSEAQEKVAGYATEFLGLEDFLKSAGVTIHDGETAVQAAIRVYMDARATVTSLREAYSILEAQHLDLGEQLKRLAQFVIDKIAGEPSQGEGVVDTVIRILSGIFDKPADEAVQTDPTPDGSLYGKLTQYVTRLRELSDDLFAHTPAPPTHRVNAALTDLETAIDAHPIAPAKAA